MKNATQLHEDKIVEYLSDQGCESIRVEKGSIVALRPGRDGRLYRLSVDLYEEASPNVDPIQRFRVRAAKRFGLPVISHHGACVHSALSNLPWQTLDRPLRWPQVQVLAGVI